MRHLHCTKPVVHAQLEIPRRSDMHLRIAPRVHQAPSGSRVPRGHHPRCLQSDLRAVEDVDSEFVERGYGQGELERFEEALVAFRGSEPYGFLAPRWRRMQGTFSIFDVRSTIALTPAHRGACGGRRHVIPHRRRYMYRGGSTCGWFALG